jgi:predicted DsbA family dithiol-disulfide isomerase
MNVEIWSDVVCPWCYIGKRRFEAALARFEHADEVSVTWRSFELDPRAPGRPTGTMAERLAAKYGSSVADAERRLAELDRLAAADGLSYHLAATPGGNTFDAHRLIHLGAQHDQGDQVKEALLHAYFTDLEPIGDPEVLARVAVGAGLDAAEVADVLGSDRFSREVRDDERRAEDIGVTGVPFFVIDGTFAVPGAQDADVFLSTLRRAWAKRHPLAVVEGPEAGSCAGDACVV